MELKSMFNKAVHLYDKLRPTYIGELYDDIIDYSGIGSESRALEIGIGTGQATLPFFKLNCFVTAIELGNELAAFTMNKFNKYKNLNVVNLAFEDYECSDNFFDIIYSATAFHWIPEEIGYTKVYKLLKSGGIFARFANHPFKDKENEPLHFAFQELYKEYMPHIMKEPVEYSRENAEEKADISKKYGFIDVKYKMYNRIRTFDADSYADLIKTYSDHIALGAEKLELFSCKIKEAINNFGGKINIYDTIDLQLARKP